MDIDEKAIVTSVATDIIKSGITLGWEKIKTYFKDLDASADIEYRTAYEDYLKNTKDKYGKIKLLFIGEKEKIYTLFMKLQVYLMQVKYSLLLILIIY